MAHPVLLRRTLLDAWLVRKNYDDASALISPQAYACVNLYLDPGEPPKSTAAEQLARLRAGLERVSVQAGPGKPLEQILSPSNRPMHGWAWSTIPAEQRSRW